MFGQMVDDLKMGRLPEIYPLRKRFELALIKKMGVIKTPYSFWPGDTKINPPTKQLLWASILLHDKENFGMVAAIISAEVEEKQRAKGKSAGIGEINSIVNELLESYIQEFIGLAPDDAFRETLMLKAAELFPHQ